MLRVCRGGATVDIMAIAKKTLPHPKSWYALRSRKTVEWAVSQPQMRHSVYALTVQPLMWMAQSRPSVTIKVCNAEIVLKNSVFGEIRMIFRL